jgi:cytochrome c peroxidase
VNRPGSRRFLLCAIGLSVIAPAAIGAGEAVKFDANEVARIVSLGPWPPPTARDPSNRASGVPEAIAFGRRLFFEPRFSPSGYVSCVACHQPDRGFTDALPRARGLAPVERNAHRAADLRLQRWYGWGGASDSLWMASLRPILDPREIGGDAEKVAFVIRTGDGVACRYRAAFGADPDEEKVETVLVNVGKALAAYEETLVTWPHAVRRFSRSAGARRCLAGNLPGGRASGPQGLRRPRKLRGVS